MMCREDEGVTRYFPRVGSVAAVASVNTAATIGPYQYAHSLVRMSCGNQPAVPIVWTANDSYSSFCFPAPREGTSVHLFPVSNSKTTVAPTLVTFAVKYSTPSDSST